MDEIKIHEDESKIKSSEVPKKSSWKKKNPRPSNGDSPSIGIDLGDTAVVKPVGLSFSGSYATQPSLPSPIGDSFNDDGIPFSSSAATALLPPASAMQNILDYFKTCASPKPNSSTVPIPHANAELLYELDRVSQEITARILAHLNDATIVPGTPIIFLEYDRSLAVHRVISASELQRHRQLFVRVNSQHPPSSTAVIGASYIDLLATQI